MGQKVNPNFYRINYFHKYASTWYANACNYSDFAKLDYDLRISFQRIFDQFIGQGIVNLTRYKLANGLNLTYVILVCFVPYVNIEEGEFTYKSLGLGKYEEEIVRNNEEINDDTALTENLPLIYDVFIFNLKHEIEEIGRQYFFNNKTLLLYSLNFTSSLFYTSSLLAKNIARAIEANFLPKNLLKQLFSLAENCENLLGLKVWVSGRLSGDARAKPYKRSYGRIPLSTISSNISFFYDNAQTLHGVIGIKVWICRD